MFTARSCPAPAEGTTQVDDVSDSRGAPHVPGWEPRRPTSLDAPRSARGGRAVVRILGHRVDRFALWAGGALLLVSLASAVMGWTWSMFTSTQDAGSNSFATGTVVIGDNDGSTAILGISGGMPGAFDEGCITVDYSGTLPATVRLYGSQTAASTPSLAQYLDLRITRGTFSTAPSFDACSTFTPDATDYVGAGSGVIYNGTLANFDAAHTNFANGLTDPSAAAEVWTTSETHVYQVRVTVQNNPAAAGLNVTHTFSWEAQNN
jgi:hypothetical protein